MFDDFLSDPGWKISFSSKRSFPFADIGIWRVISFTGTSMTASGAGGPLIVTSRLHGETSSRQGPPMPRQGV
jgi:hypothetical protein